MILAATNLTKTVASAGSPLTVLDNVSMTLPEASSLAIVGASGSGKSTLLGLLAGLDTPTSGQVILDGEDITALDEEGRAGIRAESVGFVFQSFQLMPGLTALENVMLPLELSASSGAEARARELLDQVGLGDRLLHYPKQLSGGEQQRVAVARAFASQPRILFADEPTGNLDATTGETVINLLFDLNRQQKATLVLVTHEQRLADRCEFQLQLAGGRVQASNLPTATAGAL